MKNVVYLLLLISSFAHAEKPYSKYFIAIKKNEGDPLTHLDSYIPLVPPTGKFYADPFVYKYQGINYIFFEDYDYKKGIISYVTLDASGLPSSPQIALELSTHLSFPCIFQEKEKVYLIPETYRRKSVSLYEAENFPSKWKHKRVLVQGEMFSDPVLFKYNGFYWLFVSVHMDELRIYYAKI